jgi:DNA-binding transcriptional LysR family regulator
LCDRTFKIGIPDHWASLILPKLIPLIQRNAPKIIINIIPLTQMYSAEPFEKEYYDIGIARASVMPPSIHAELLLRDEGVCVLNRNHPLAKKKKITMSDFNTYQHIACRTENPEFPSVINQFLISKGRPIRDTILYVPYIDVVFRLIEKSNHLIGSAVKSKTLLSEGKHHCVIRPSPFKQVYSEFYIAWHKQMNNDSAHRWLRDQIIAIVKNLEKEKYGR